jgi:SAM-dependent methyltransferase
MTTKEYLKTIVPLPARLWLRRQQLRVDRLLRSLPGRGDICSLRRKTPVCTRWGGSRGQCVDRYYIEQFLAEQAADIRGHVLEFADDGYTRKYGGAKVTKVDVLHHEEGNPNATIITDLANGEQIPSGAVDCVVCTQVLLMIYDVHAAVRTLYRILKPGGVVLVTAPGVACKIVRAEMRQGSDYWRFTSLSLRRMFEEVFPLDTVQVKAYGNVLAASAFLYGFATEDLRTKDLDYHDPDYEVLIALRAVKRQPQGGAKGVQSH